MAKSKLQRIRALCEADPSNPFGWYSLAIEQKKSDPAAALPFFERVHRDSPDYLANFYHYALTLAETGEPERAKEIFAQGIELARKTNDTHTLGELQDALAAVS